MFAKPSPYIARFLETRRAETALEVNFLTWLSLYGQSMKPFLTRESHPASVPDITAIKCRRRLSPSEGRAARNHLKTTA
jgi:hypothetical protein